MHAMRYAITLPADYDMDVIRERVATRGHALDEFPGLGLKSYLIRERGVAGSPVNQYAPFYLWRTPAGMNDFLWGKGFQGICDDFGRPVVQHWLGLAFEHGPAHADSPISATTELTTLRTAEPGTAVQAAIADLTAHAATPGVHCTALAIDPRTWELLRYTLWCAEPPAEAGVHFQVLHLSRPELDQLPTGRHW
ncbi:DUF4865 family protein [Crossiella sp. CA-258035]|uniref:DUF4865 family protein n=1 Tax=Crossiella sp. CA-258035 TaxID=2981138 RepID=UPI0024BCBDAD|nr:DUF4865 family protein [Crossiella sp. CA-258035]WHT17118.1 DUF4865 family protein [Crossiella sp. CA-258035]